MMLFVGYMEMPTPEQQKMYYESEKAAHVSITKDDADAFKRLGYTDEQIKKMQDELSKANNAR